MAAYEAWFRLADEDRDGSVGGAEAVKFFSRSGLGRETLGQIWELASGGGAKLDMGQFTVAMHLVSLAQAAGGPLPLDQARATVSSRPMGPAVPPPRLQGLEAPVASSAWGQAALQTFPAASAASSASQPAASAGAVSGYSGAIAQGGAGTTGHMAGAAMYAPHMTGSYVQQMTGGYAPQMTGGYAAQMTGGYAAPAASGPGMQQMYYNPQLTGQPAVASAQPQPQQQPGQSQAQERRLSAGSSSGPPGSQPQWPPLGADQRAGYDRLFAQLGGEASGSVPGSACFDTFMRWGLDKAVLKQVWALVAGDAGALSRTQWCQALYLMDCAKAGIQPPAQLPPGPFPPAATGTAGGAQASMPPPQAHAAQMLHAASAPGAVGASSGMMAGMQQGLMPAMQQPADTAAAQQQQQQQAWTLQSQFGAGGMQGATASAYGAPGAMMMGGGLPSLPPQAQFNPASVALPARESKLPVVPEALMGMLHGDERSKIERELANAGSKQSALWAAQQGGDMAKRKAEFYGKALQELMMFKSRTDVALLQAQEQEARLANEAEALAKRYAAAYAGAQAQGSESAALRQRLSSLMAARNDAQAKLASLEAESAMLASLGPEQLASMEAEVAALGQAVVAAEAQRAQQGLSTDHMRKQHEVLSKQLAELQAGLQAAGSELAAAKADVEAVQQQLATVRASSDVASLQGLLLRAAKAYRTLFAHAQRSGVEVPIQAAPSSIGPLAWVQEAMAPGTGDWQQPDEAEDKGFVLVNALPELDAAPATPGPGGSTPLAFANARSAAQAPPQPAGAMPLSPGLFGSPWPAATQAPPAQPPAASSTALPAAAAPQRGPGIATKAAAPDPFADFAPPAARKSSTSGGNAQSAFTTAAAASVAAAVSQPSAVDAGFNATGGAPSMFAVPFDTVNGNGSSASNQAAFPASSFGDDAFSTFSAGDHGAGGMMPTLAPPAPVSASSGFASGMGGFDDSKW